MEFRDSLTTFVNRVESIRGHINSEEATKVSLVLPFIQLLGYDIFNPLEVVPEFVADVGIKKGEKVDYAIIMDSNPIMLVEAKCIGEDLSKHYNQLFRYFTATKAKIGLLTDGIIYKFYTDTLTPNIMDSEPFLTVDMLNITANNIVCLESFIKGNFSIQDVLNISIANTYEDNIRKAIMKLLYNPSDDLISVILKESNIVAKDSVHNFKFIVRGILNEVINDVSSVVIDGLSPTVDVCKDDIVEYSIDNIKDSGLNIHYFKYKDIKVNVGSWKEFYSEAFKCIVRENAIHLNSLVDTPIKLFRTDVASIILSNDRDVVTYTYYDTCNKKDAIFKPTEVSKGVYLTTPPMNANSVLSKVRKFCNYFCLNKGDFKIGVSK